MPFAIPQFLSLIESNPSIKQIQAMVKPKIVTKNYKTIQERNALQSGSAGEVSRAMELTGELNPGIINIIYHFIGINLVDGCKVSLYLLSKYVLNFSLLYR
jgi:hypothetical protein